MRIKLKIFLISLASFFSIYLNFFGIEQFDNRNDVSIIKEDECVINIRGGLGNNMFQYAAAYVYTQKHNKKLKITGRYERFIETFSLPEEKIKNLLHPTNTSYNEQNMKNNFAKEINNPRYQFLNGYFQNELFFKEYRADILKRFKFKVPLEGENKKLADEIKDKNAISVHIRRGDYFKSAKNDLLSNHYYLLAMDYMASKVKNPYFYIFSDDTEWVKNNLKVQYNHIVVENNRGGVAANDMRLMSLCKHHIIANSTFSWWGAWLNENPNKMVIAPRVWLTNKQAYEDTKDVVPNDWIRMKEKADIAIVFLSDNHNGASEKSFNKHFLPFDRKKYFTKNELGEVDFKRLDYLFIVKKPFILSKEVNYQVVPYKEGVLYFSFDGQNFVAGSLNTNDVIAIKAPISLEYIKSIIE